MNSLIEELKSRFFELEKRERNALLGLLCFLAVIVFYLFIWQPVYQFVEDAERAYDRHLNLLEYLKSTEEQARSSKKQAKPVQDGKSLLTTVSRTAQTVGVNPNRIQPEGANSVGVWFDNVAFTRLMLFLERLESGQRIVVRQITIEGQEEPGKVSSRVVLRN